MEAKSIFYFKMQPPNVLPTMYLLENVVPVFFFTGILQTGFDFLSKMRPLDHLG